MSLASLAGLASTAARTLQSGSNPFLEDEPPQNACELTAFGCLESFYCNPTYGLADAGYGYCYVKEAYGKLAVVPTENLAWLDSHGTQSELIGGRVCQWMAFALCIGMLIFYAYDTWKATTGWEECYVCIVELVKVCLEIFHEFDAPASLYLSTGNWVLWLRYGEWLLTCPVILIHLSNITGLKDDYSKRTMRLLVSDIGCVVWGITAAISVGYLKWVFFALGMLYGSNTYFHAAKVYMEAYHTVPKGRCRVIVRLMAYCFYAAWTMYPILFALGPEGMAQMTGYNSTITTTVADVLSKQTWGLLGHYLRVKIYEHILIHGDIRKTTTMQVAGEEIEVEEIVDADDEDGVKHSTSKLANRESFVNMANNMKARGIDVRASLDSGDDTEMTQMGGALEPGRVILSVPDLSMVDYFRMQFSQLPAPIELVPALGMDNTLQLVQQAAALGGCDCVMVHPEFLKDTSPNGLLGKLRMMGQRVTAFGWAPAGPARELIESRGLDGWVEGPSFGSGIDQKELAQLIARIQQMKKQAMMGGMGGKGMMMPYMMQNNMMAHNGMMGHTAATPLLAADMSGHNSFMIRANADMAGHMNGMNSGMHTPMPATTMGSMGGVNPLYGSAPSPMGSQLGNAGPSSVPGNVTPPSPAGGNANEAEMLQQLMGEIIRLKSELGGAPR